MLKPSMNELMKRVGNRYLLVNLAAQRARDIAQEAEETGEPLPDKAVKLALDEIAAGTIVHKPGPKIEEPKVMIPRELSGTLDLDLDFDEDGLLDDEEEHDAEDHEDIGE
ncbi:DNA-directed RNA polymerase subunit omega [Intestinibacillus sp. Marseille-P6563]|uniref:DNA-directed RNA polymerase subunit omega n=1 Tax=Intestinibacillus sp. Marseille-P6563 TaxID=2364792 RepID=UPI000F06DADD|nr:DNA-directed RNA polymerase subunit omega [Intestinibacillus sp. Marseille-P6563]